MSSLVLLPDKKMNRKNLISCKQIYIYIYEKIKQEVKKKY